MPLTKGQQTACLLGRAGPCSSCCRYVRMGRSAQPDTAPAPAPRGPICTLPDRMEVEEGSAEAQAAGPPDSHHCH